MRAITSCPVPVSPWINAEQSEFATRAAPDGGEYTQRKGWARNSIEVRHAHLSAAHTMVVWAAACFWGFLKGFVWGTIQSTMDVEPAKSQSQQFLNKETI